MIEPIQPEVGGGNAALPANKSWDKKPPMNEPMMPRMIVPRPPIGSGPGMRNRAMTPMIAPKTSHQMMVMRSMFTHLLSCFVRSEPSQRSNRATVVTRSLQKPGLGAVGPNYFSAELTFARSCPLSDLDRKQGEPYARTQTPNP